MFNSPATLANNAIDALRDEKRRLKLASKSLQRFTMITIIGRPGKLYSVERVYELAKGLESSVDAVEIDDRDFFAIGEVCSFGIGEIERIVRS